MALERCIGRGMGKLESVQLLARLGVAPKFAMIGGFCSSLFLLFLLVSPRLCVSVTASGHMPVAVGAGAAFCGASQAQRRLRRTAACRVP